MPSLNNAPLIVAAMPSEMRHALDVAQRVDGQRLGPWVRWNTSIDGQPVNLLLTGIGMVNAGAALSRSLCDLSPESVINFGCVGAHRPDINPGDVVIGTRYVNHRAVTVLPSGDEKHAGTAIAPEDSSHFIDGFEADPSLLATARAAAMDWSLDPWPGSTVDRTPAIHAGPLTSADTWTQSIELIERINAEHRTFCEDMEAAALAQICSMHQIPFLAIKDISNNEYHAATDHGLAGGPTLDSVVDEVGRRAFELVRRMLQQWN